MKKRIIGMSVLILAVTILLSGCTNIQSIGSTGIKDIVDNPGKYEGQEVTVSGKVIEVIDMGEYLRTYKINDGAASIEVKVDTITVKKGEQLVMKGTVKAVPQGVYIDASTKSLDPYGNIK